MNDRLRPIRWGILGTARVARKVVAGMHRIDSAEPLAVASRNQQRAADWAAQYQLPQSFGSYQALLDCDEIDAVYIPLPPSLHCEWTIKAAEAGKHVLCEKPFALSVLQARAMVDACRKHDRQLMEGVMWRHHPRAAQMKELLQAGTLGDLHKITAAFSSYWDDGLKENIRSRRDLGGGSLGDLGWYCLGAALWAFEDLPLKVWGTARFENNIDTSFNGVMWFADDRIASFDCSFDTALRKWFEVAGSRGSIVCDDFTRPWDIEKTRFWVHDASGKSVEHRSPPLIQEDLMLDQFCRVVQSGQREDEWPDMALKTQLVFDALDQSARTGSEVEIDGSLLDA